MATPATKNQPQPIQSPTAAFQAVDPEGFLTPGALSTITQIWQRINGASIIIPCIATNPSGNLILLTPMVQSPTPSSQPGSAAVQEDYDTYAFISPRSTNGLTTIQLAGFAALKAFKLNGSAQVGNGDMTINLQYMATFTDTLDSGVGGYVVR